MQHWAGIPVHSSSSTNFV